MGREVEVGRGRAGRRGRGRAGRSRRPCGRHTRPGRSSHRRPGRRPIGRRLQEKRVCDTALLEPPLAGPELRPSGGCRPASRPTPGWSGQAFSRTSAGLSRGGGGVRLAAVAGPSAREGGRRGEQQGDQVRDGRFGPSSSSSLRRGCGVTRESDLPSRQP